MSDNRQHYSARWEVSDEQMVDVEIDGKNPLRIRHNEPDECRGLQRLKPARVVHD
jgi:hypothetical protein